MIADLNYIVLLLHPLLGSADYDDVWYLYENVDPNNKNDLNEIIKREIIPYYNEINSLCQKNIKSSLVYYLHNDPYDLYYAFSSCLIAFSPPDDIRLFFSLIYENLYNDDWKAVSTNNIVITDDISVRSRCLE